MPISEIQSQFQCQWNGNQIFSSKRIYRISMNSFHGIYSFLNLEIVENSNSCRKLQFFYLFAAETIQGGG